MMGLEFRDLAQSDLKAREVMLLAEGLGLFQVDYDLYGGMCKKILIWFFHLLSH